MTNNLIIIISIGATKINKITTIFPGNKMSTRKTTDYNIIMYVDNIFLNLSSNLALVHGYI